MSLHEGRIKDNYVEHNNYERKQSAVTHPFEGGNMNGKNEFRRRKRDTILNIMERWNRDVIENRWKNRGMNEMLVSFHCFPAYKFDLIVRFRSYYKSGQ